MFAHFNRDGIAFSYPENWTLQREETPNGWTVMLQSPETAFLLLSCDEEMTNPELVAQMALEALRQEYAELEADEAVETLAGQPAIGHDIHFFSLDLTNTCWTRAFFGAQGTVLLMWQMNDLELETNGPVLRAICASLTVTED